MFNATAAAQAGSRSWARTPVWSGQLEHNCQCDPPGVPFKFKSSGDPTRTRLSSGVRARDRALGTLDRDNADARSQARALAWMTVAW